MTLRNLLITFGILGVIAIMVTVPIIVWIKTADAGATIVVIFIVIGAASELVRPWRILSRHHATRDSP